MAAADISIDPERTAEVDDGERGSKPGGNADQAAGSAS